MSAGGCCALGVVLVLRVAAAWTCGVMVKQTPSPADRAPSVAPSNIAHGKFSKLHKNPRRSSRPIAPKGKKAARLLAESAAEAAKKVVVVDSVNAEKRRLLQKLLARQTAAGKAEAAAQTQQQIDSLA